MVRLSYKTLLIINGTSPYTVDFKSPITVH